MATSKLNLGTLLAGGLVLISAAAVIAGLVIVGSPQKARDNKRDNNLLQALVISSRTLQCYKQNFGSLTEDPQEMIAALNALPSTKNDANKNRCTHADWPDDPIAGADVSYRDLNEETFEICGNFLLPDPKMPESGNHSNNILIGLNTPRQSAGEHCYISRPISSLDE